MPTPDDDDSAMRARLDKLSTALGERQARASAEQERSARSTGSDTGSAMSKGLRAASELVAGIVVGGLVGVALDSWLGTKPWFSIIFFLLGMVAGFWNVIRGAMKPTGDP